MIRYTLFAGICVAMAFACGGGDGGGGSGVDGNKLMVDLDDTELTDICTFQADLVEPREVDCDGQTITIEPQAVADCVMGLQDTQDAFPDCGVTVSQFEACSSAVAGLSDAEICAFIFEGASPAACDALDTAECGGAG